LLCLGRYALGALCLLGVAVTSRVLGPGALVPGRAVNASAGRAGRAMRLLGVLGVLGSLAFRAGSGLWVNCRSRVTDRLRSLRRSRENQMGHGSEMATPALHCREPSCLIVGSSSSVRFAYSRGKQVVFPRFLCGKPPPKNKLGNFRTPKNG
jgi:hypothetical protein